MLWPGGSSFLCVSLARCCHARLAFGTAELRMMSRISPDLLRYVRQQARRRSMGVQLASRVDQGAFGGGNLAAHVNDLADGPHPSDVVLERANEIHLELQSGVRAPFR